MALAHLLGGLVSDDRYCCPCGIPTLGPGDYCPTCEPPEKKVACLVCDAETWDTCICEASR